MLVTSYESFHLGFILRNIYRGKISDEWFSPVYGGGRNHGDQLVCRQLFDHQLLLFLGRRLDKVMNENSMENRCLG
jgi:hypothetical protein